ncbi:MAG: ATP-grasp domain-containing protein [Candidatus Doudnabacteria bacterium]|nr:ATP-grasp domain-containing protein [Candidatus Doudnabacteria bacterium]
MSNEQQLLILGRKHAAEFEQIVEQRGFKATCIPREAGMQALQSVLEQPIAGVIATNDGGSLMAAYVAEQAEVLYPSVRSVVLCQHKLKSRDAQMQWIPNAVPRYTGITLSAFAEGKRPNLSEVTFPVIVKPFRSSFSRATAICTTEEEVESWIEQNAEQLRRTNDTYRGLWSDITGGQMPLDGFIIEERAEGEQVTLDGYVHNGEVRFIGVTDSVLLYESLSFARFEYPSAIDEHIQEEMRQITRDVLRGIGFDNGFFNIEFVAHHQYGVKLVEINSRPSMQFQRLFEWVDGVKLLDMMVEEAVGGDPEKRLGERHAREDGVAFCYVFRRERDGLIASMPTAEDIRRAKAPLKNGHVSLFAPPGTKLSSLSQDAMTYRYAYAYGHVPERIQVGAAIAHMEDVLPFTFTDQEE